MMEHDRSDGSDSKHRGRGGRDRSRDGDGGRARPRGHARKERVLHTRVSEQLSDDIRRFAEDLRVPASNLVRNVLEEVFAVVDSVTDDVGDLFDDVLEEAEAVRERVRNQAESAYRRSSRRARRDQSRSEPGSDDDIESELRRDEASQAGPESAKPEPPESPEPRAAELFPDVLGWQPLVLNRDFDCGRCGRRLRPGESAFLGVGETGLTRTALCGPCAGSR